MKKTENPFLVLRTVSFGCPPATCISAQYSVEHVPVQVYNGAANQTSLTLIIAATNTSMSTLDSVSLRVSQSLLSSQLEPDTVDSKLLIPEQQTTLHSSCDANGLQSSVEFSQVALTAGKATIEVGSYVMCPPHLPHLLSTFSNHSAQCIRQCLSAPCSACCGQSWLACFKLPGTPPPSCPPCSAGHTFECTDTVALTFAASMAHSLQVCTPCIACALLEHAAQHFVID